MGRAKTFEGTVGLIDEENSERGCIVDFFGEGKHASIDLLLGRALEGRHVKVTIEVLDEPNRAERRAAGDRAPIAPAAWEKV